MTTIREAAEMLNVSERSGYYARVVARHGIADWERLIMAGRKGHAPKISWAARVCKFADHDAQRALIKIIEEDGIKFARAVWAHVEARHSRTPVPALRCPHCGGVIREAAP